MFYRLVLIMIVGVLSSFALQAAEGDDDYVLGIGDRIKIEVYGEPDLTIRSRIGKSGVITYPFLGEVSVVELTPKQLANKIDAGLRGPYIVDPAVHVSVEEYRPFFINGEVKRPGSYPYQPGLSLSKAVAIAGGFTERASSTKWMITRKENNAERELEATIDTLISPGDIITIKQSFF